jgi:hypothetical protein
VGRRVLWPHIEDELIGPEERVANGRGVILQSVLRVS